VSPVPYDDGAQRELERHALRNAGWLAAKLGYGDAIDRRTERWIVAAIAFCVVAATAWVVMSVRAGADEDEARLQRQRCEVDFRVKNFDRVRYRIMQEHPEMTPVQRGQMMEEKIQSEAVASCAARTPAR